MPETPDFPAALEHLERALAALPTEAIQDQESKYRLDYLRTLEQLLALQMRVLKLQKKYAPSVKG